MNKHEGSCFVCAHVSDVPLSWRISERLGFNSLVVDALNCQAQGDLKGRERGRYGWKLGVRDDIDRSQPVALFGDLNWPFNSDQPPAAKGFHESTVPEQMGTSRKLANQ